MLRRPIQLLDVEQIGVCNDRRRAFTDRAVSDQPVAANFAASRARRFFFALYHVESRAGGNCRKPLNAALTHRDRLETMAC